MKWLLATPGGTTPLAGSDDDAPLVGVIPGDDVALHRIELMETAQKGRLAEARMRATDLSAQPLEDLHLALGPPQPDGSAWLALIARERMAAHIGHFAAHGAEPQSITPAALLLPAPADAVASVATLDPFTLVRSTGFAAAADPLLAEALGALPQTPPPPFAAAFALPEVLLLDLRQGEFAARIRWWRLAWFRVAAGFLLVGILALALAPLAIDRIRTGAAADAADRITIQLATQALGQTQASPESAALALSAARIAAEGRAIGPRLSFIAASIEQTPAARLDSLRLLPDATIALVLAGPAEAINSARARLTAGPFVATAAARAVRIAARRTARPTSDAALPTAIARTLNAQSDASIVRRTAASPRPLSPQAIAAAFAAAGLEATPGNPIRIEAARATVLLPLLADLEARGARFASLGLTRNEDQTLSAQIGFAP